MKYYTVADPHGFLTEMKAALAEAGYFDDTGEKRLVVLGDALDRGKEAVAMTEFLLSEHDAGRLIYVLGNHEELLVSAMTELAAYGEIKNLSHLTNGTWDTLIQLSGLDCYEAESDPELLVTLVRQSDFYKTLLSVCVDYHETKRYVFCHGYIPTKASFEGGNAEFTYDPDWRNADLAAKRRSRWVNGMDMCVKYGIKEKGKTVVCGHWHCSYGHAVIDGKGEEYGKNAIRTPYYADGIIALDATTAASRTVNCIVLDDLGVK